jgi:hypothetical protein
METWELVARERIRDTLARYTWSGDAGRLDDLALAFCDDGVLELRSGGRATGRAEIAALLSSRVGDHSIVRHDVSNVRFASVTSDEAHVVSYFTVFTEVGLDHFGRYRDVFAPVGDEWLLRHRLASIDWSGAPS